MYITETKIQVSKYKCGKKLRKASRVHLEIQLVDNLEKLWWKFLKSEDLKNFMFSAVSGVLFLLIFLFEGKCIGGVSNFIQCATHFRIKHLKSEDSKLITDGAGRKLLLVHHIDKVTVKNINAVIKIPVKRVITRWSTIPSFLRSLGVEDTIVAVVTREEEPCDEYIKHRIYSRNIEIIGGPSSIDYEKLIVLNPDIFFISKWQSIKISKKLNQLNISYAVIAEYLEDNPLGRTEWIKFFATFYDREKIAQKIFSRVVKKIKEIEVRLRCEKLKPKILWCFIRQDGTIYVPRGDSYVAKMIAMAGGNYVFKQLKKVNNVPISLEYFYLCGRDADIYISAVPLPQYGITSIKKLTAFHPMLCDFKSIKKGNVWYLCSYYWESAEKIDEIIEDLAAVFHPRLFPNHKPKYFFKLFYLKKGKRRD